ncbi:MAG: GspH/FimT family pseudopilin [Thiotrichales bacterium]
MKGLTGMPGRSRGLTLAELLVTLSVSGVIVQTAVTSLSGFMTANLLSTQANGIMSNLFIARSEAVKRNARVIMRRTGARWEEGWITFVDSNDNGLYETSEKLLAQQGRLPGRLTLQGNRPLAQYVSYVGSGQSQKLSGAMQAGRFMLCDQTGQSHPQHARTIVISTTGRPRISSKKSDLRDCS